MKKNKSVSLRTVSLVKIYAEIKRRRKRVAALKKKQLLLNLRLATVAKKIADLGGK